jgi:dephospho-CoA kinase
MKVIGITGGIGSGKSTVSSFLRDRGFVILDADGLSHRMTDKGGAALPEIRSSFGEDYFYEDGSLDREKMAGLVFSSREARSKLEKIVTEKVISTIKGEINDLREAGSYDIIFVDAPLLYESGADSLTDAVWLVTAAESIRIERVMARDNVSREDVIKRIHNQMPEAEKAARADDIIDNSKGKEELAARIEFLLEKYA